MADRPTAPPVGLASETFAGRLATFARIRWLVAGASFAYALGLLLLELNRLLAITLPAPLFLSLLPLFFVAYNTLSLALTRRGRLKEAAAVGVGGDLIAVTAGLYGTGGTSSWLWALYPLVTLEAAYVTERVRPTVATVVAGSALYAIALVFETIDGRLLPPMGMPEAVVEGYLAVKISWVALMNAAAALAGLVAILALRDARRSLEAAYRRLDAQYTRLSELDRMKSSFLSVVSHELRTPIAILRGYTELVEEDRNLSPESREYLGKAEASAEALTGKINMMIAYSALASGQEVLHPATHRAGELLKTVVARMEAGVREAGLVLMAEPPDPALTLEADAGHLAEALCQLVCNARAATPRGGTVGLRAAPAGPWAEFEVWDTGPGMPGPVRARLGEPFVQASTSLCEHAPGLGLGLAYAHLVAKLHGGELAALDRPEGGTRVLVRLPRAPVQERPGGKRSVLSTDGIRGQAG